MPKNKKLRPNHRNRVAASHQDRNYWVVRLIKSMSRSQPTKEERQGLPRTKPRGVGLFVQAKVVAGHYDYALEKKQS